MGGSNVFKPHCHPGLPRVGFVIGLVMAGVEIATGAVIAHGEGRAHRNSQSAQLTDDKGPLRTPNVGVSIAQSRLITVGQQAHTQEAIAALPNDTYQFCSEPEPQDWPLGAGVCFWFHKTGSRVVGYYGYPHSDHFVDCVMGKVSHNQIHGQAFAIAWPGSPWDNIPASSFKWDRDGYLSLGQSATIPVVHQEIGSVEVVRFDQVTLTLDGFYRYSAKKAKQMKSPPKTCKAASLVP